MTTGVLAPAFLYEVILLVARSQWLIAEIIAQALESSDLCMYQLVT